MDCKIKNTTKCEDFTIVISDDDEVITKASEAEVKRNHKQKKRKVTLKTEKETSETLIITQEVKLKKQHYKCVINLNTNVYNNNIDEYKSEAVKKQLDSSLAEDNKNGHLNNSSDRKVPTCGRKKCQTPSIQKSQAKRKHKSSKHNGRTCHSKLNNNMKKSRKGHYNYSSKHETHSKRKINNEKSPKLKDLSLSPISLSPMKNNMDYDDISLDSFTSCSESELDTLIKRTKERDRLTLYGTQPMCCSTQQNMIKLPSDEEMFDDISLSDTSIHSVETVILKPEVDISVQSPQKAIETVTRPISSNRLSDNEFCDRNFNNLNTHKLKNEFNMYKNDTQNLFAYETKQTLHSSFDNINNNVSHFHDKY